MPKSFLPQALEIYLNQLEPLPEVLDWIRQESEPLEGAEMLTTPDQLRFFLFLVPLMNARTIIDVGTFTGLSSTAFALASPAGGQIITIDAFDNQYTAIARNAWHKAGISDKIRFIHGDGVDTLKSLTSLWGQTDLIFLDARKNTYVDLYEESLKLLRPGGLIIADNMFMGGQVMNLSTDKGSVRSIRQFTQHVVSDIRVKHHMLPLGDGLMLIRKNDAVD